MAGLCQRFIDLKVFLKKAVIYLKKKKLVVEGIDIGSSDQARAEKTTVFCH
jgi:hypothetical protein